MLAESVLSYHDCKQHQNNIYDLTVPRTRLMGSTRFKPATSGQGFVFSFFPKEFFTCGFHFSFELVTYMQKLGDFTYGLTASLEIEIWQSWKHILVKQQPVGACPSSLCSARETFPVQGVYTTYLGPKAFIGLLPWSLFLHS